MYNLNQPSGIAMHLFFSKTYSQWGDKTLYLKNNKCSGEPKNMAALTLNRLG